MAPATGNAQDIQERTLKFPSASNKGHPQVMGVQKFAELVEEKSGGKITVKPFPGGVLGPDLQTVSAMQGGTIDLTVMNASLLAGNAKEFAVLDFPYLFGTAAEADAVVDGPVGQKLFDKLPEKGLVGLGLLGSRVPRHEQREAADRDGGGSRGPEDAGHPDADLHRLHERAGRQRRADAVHRDLHGSRDRRDRRHDQPAAQHSTSIEVLRGDHSTTHACPSYRRQDDQAVDQ